MGGAMFGGTDGAKAGGGGVFLSTASIVVLASLLMLMPAFSGGGNLYAQEADDTDDTPQETVDSEVEIPDDDEIASLLNEAQNPNAVVGPLLKTKWSQRSPYNDLFPIADAGYTGGVDSKKRMVTICNNTAVAQVMAFHRHPARGSGESTRISPHRVNVPPVNFNVAYDWNNMLNSYRSDGGVSSERQRNAVATLMYHVAAARGATTTSTNIPTAMVIHFGYDRSIQRLSREFYTDTEWETIIRAQLDAGLPVIYRGDDPENGHHWVVDGYDSVGRFHINWGWGGGRDGWYSLNNMNPRGKGRREFYNNQWMYINVKPNTGGSPAPYEMALKAFACGKTSIFQNEMFTVTIKIRNNSTFENFPGGQLGIALVDTNGRILQVIGSRNRAALTHLSSSKYTEINCFVPETIRLGQYRVMAVIRPKGGNWETITRSAVGDGIPNAINLMVAAETGAPGGGYGLLLEDFSPAKTVVLQNESFTVNYKLRNLNSDVFRGDFGAALVDNAGNILEVVGIRKSTSVTNSRTSDVSCKVPNTIRPGRYCLRMVTRSAGREWRVATMSIDGVPNSIDFTVR